MAERIYIGDEDPEDSSYFIDVSATLMNRLAALNVQTGEGIADLLAGSITGDVQIVDPEDDTEDEDEDE